MVYKINPFHASVWHSPDTLQIGLDSHKVVIPQLSAAAEKFIDALYFGVAPNQVAALAGQVRLPQTEAVKLLQRLRPVLEIAAPIHSQQPNPGQPINLDAAFADLVAASLKTATDGRAVLQERGRRAVFIDDLDATGLMLMLGLAAAGVGTFVTRDNTTVRSADTGPASFPPAFHGQKRIAAATLMLQATWPSSQLVSALRLKDTKLNNIDVAVLTNELVAEPLPIGTWNARQVPQLEIRFEAGGFSVSPVIIPGVTPCLVCRELWASANQPEYVAVNSQLAGTEIRYDHTANRLLAAGFAMQNILVQLDCAAGFGVRPYGGAGVERGAGVAGGYVVRDAGPSGGGPAVRVAELGWDYHPDCSCALLNAPAAIV